MKSMRTTREGRLLPMSHRNSLSETIRDPHHRHRLLVAKIEASLQRDDNDYIENRNNK